MNVRLRKALDSLFFVERTRGHDSTEAVALREQLLKAISKWDPRELLDPMRTRPELHLEEDEARAAASDRLKQHQEQHQNLATMAGVAFLKDPNHPKIPDITKAMEHHEQAHDEMYHINKTLPHPYSGHDITPEEAEDFKRSEFDTTGGGSPKGEQLKVDTHRDELRANYTGGYHGAGTTALVQKVGLDQFKLRHVDGQGEDPHIFYFSSVDRDDKNANPETTMSRDQVRRELGSGKPFYPDRD